MIPIFEQGYGQGIGHSFESFIKRFIEICERHIDNGQAKAFAFILYDFQDREIKEILKNQGGFAQLDRLSGKDLSIFYLHSDDRQVLETFNEIFLGAFELDSNYSLPFVLFFNVSEREVTNVEVIELEQSNMLFSFKELYDILEHYIKITNGNTTKKLKSNKMTKIFQIVKKVATDKFIEYLIEKGFEKMSYGFK